jgi:hypothetical protein
MAIFTRLNLSFTSRPVVAKQSIAIYQSIAASSLIDRGLFFFKIAYLKHNLRRKLGMRELSSAERNSVPKIFRVTE